MNGEIKIRGVNELVHAFAMRKKQLLAHAIHTYYTCASVCYADVLNVSEKCELRCQQKLDGFDAVKKSCNGKYDAFLVSYDMDDMARVDGQGDPDTLRRQLWANKHVEPARR